MMRSIPRPLAILFSFLLTATAHSQMITAHRGASHDAPENTLAAFELAWQQGADAVEGDFYLTADNQIVCIHDADTLRTTGQKWVVAQTTLDELRRLDAGSWKGAAFAGQRLPTLAEALATMPEGKQFFIELKVGPEIVPVLAAELQRIEADPASLTVIAFNADTVAACKRQLPAIKVHWLTSFKRRNGIGPWAPTAKQIAATVERCGADGVGIRGERAVVDADFIAEMTRAGVPEFHVWTIDSPDDADHFVQLGAMGITTNRPAFIRESLAEAE